MAKVPKKIQEKIAKLRDEQGLSWDITAGKTGISVPTAVKAYKQFKEEKEGKTLQAVDEKEKESTISKSTVSKSVGGKKMVEGSISGLSTKIDQRIDPTTFSILDKLVEEGIAESQSDAVRKSLRLLYALAHPDKLGDTKEKTQTLSKELQEKKGGYKTLIEMKRDMLEAKSLDKALNDLGKDGAEGGFSMDKYLQYMMIQNLMKQPRQNNGNSVLLAQQLKDLKDGFDRKLTDMQESFLRKQEQREQERKIDERMNAYKEKLESALKQSTNQKGGLDAEKMLLLIREADKEKEQIKAQSDQSLAQINAKVEEMKATAERERLNKLIEAIDKRNSSDPFTKAIADKVAPKMLEKVDKAMDIGLKEGKEPSSMEILGEVLKPIAQAAAPAINKGVDTYVETKARENLMRQAAAAQMASQSREPTLSEPVPEIPITPTGFTDFISPNPPTKKK